MDNKNVTYTSTLPGRVMHELSEYASVNNKKKNEVIIEAITEFLKHKRKRQYAESFERMRNDPEQKTLAEAGMGDFLKMAAKHEKPTK
jgi:predicted Fe-S protein YdhL (DUF1289 family)